MIDGERQDLISVIVPIYNVEPYLRMCLDSILEQTYDNLEIILVASTSSDESENICDEYAKNDQRIIVINEEPKGLSAARNHGIDRSSGEYLCFIDSDDYISPDFIESLYSLCMKHECEIAQCDYMIVKKDEKFMVFGDPDEALLFSGVDMCYNLYNDMSISSVVTWSKIYRRHLFDDVRFPEGKIHEDEATTYILFFKAKRVAVTRRKLYHYRQVEGSIMGSAYSIKRLDAIQFYQERLDFFQMASESKLYALTLLEFILYLTRCRRNVRVSLSDSKSVLRGLNRKQRSIWRSIVLNKHIEIKKKIIVTMFTFFEPLVKAWNKINHGSNRAEE